VPISAPKTKIVAAFGKRPTPSDALGDATLEFGAEPAVAVRDSEPRPPIPPHRRTTQVVAAVLLVAAMGAAVYWADRLKVATAPTPSGSLKIETDPPGAEVRIDGNLRGTTPLSLNLPTGQYNVTVHQGTSVKQLPVAVTTGAVTVHHITWTDAPAIAAGSGSLSVTTDQPGGQVSIDGHDHGAAPLTVRNLTPGEHRVVVRGGGNTFTRTVRIEPGVTASLVLSAGGVAPWGWVTVATPIAVQLFEGQRLIGTSDIERIMLPGGEHQLEVVADQIGYRATQKVRVIAGQATKLALELPSAAVSINAVPWAEVSIDGNRVGETPLGNLSIAPGPHEVVFRHPQFGERRMTTLVSLKETNRISMDMRSR
jgi:hypothetical protein